MISFTHASSTFLTLILISPALADVEYGTQSALEDHAYLAKSVVKLENGAMLSRSTCSATVIGKNLLLTAHHCVNDLKVGSRVSINEKPIYKVTLLETGEKLSRAVIKVLDSSTIPLKTKMEVSNTDIAVIQVAPAGKEPSEIENLNPIPIASLTVHTELSPKAWIVGYGQTGPNRGDAGTLRAGYTIPDEQDFAPATKTAKNEEFKAVMEQLKLPLNAINSLEKRAGVYQFKNTEGSYLSSKGALKVLLGDDGAHSSVQHGDSGGPLIAFDSKGRGFIVGVSSMVVEKAMLLNPTLVIEDENQAPLSAPLTLPAALVNSENPAVAEAVMKGAINSITERLEQLRFLDESWKATRSFNVSYYTGRATVSHFASLQFSENMKLVKDALAKAK